MRFDLPDRAATYRVVAVAVASEGRGGVGETRVATSRGVRIDPRVVPALRVGDETTALLSVINETDRAVQADVALQSNALMVRPPTPQTVNVPAGGTTEVRFNLRALRVGPADVDVRLVAGSSRTSTRRRVNVTLGGDEEYVTRSGVASAASTPVRLEVPSDATSDVGGLGYTLSLSPAAAGASVALRTLEPAGDDSLSNRRVARRARLPRPERPALRHRGARGQRRSATELGRRLTGRIDTQGRARFFPSGATEAELGAWVGSPSGTRGRPGCRCRDASSGPRRRRQRRRSS